MHRLVTRSIIGTSLIGGFILGTYLGAFYTQMSSVSAADIIPIQTTQGKQHREVAATAIEISTEKEGVMDFELSYDTVNQLDLRTMVCNMEAKQLDSALRHDLQGRAEEFIQVSNEYQINVYFVCAVAAAESGWGRDLIAKEQNNYFGLRKGGEEYYLFDSFRSSCVSFCKLIDEQYLSSEGTYFSGSTLPEVAIRYNPGHQAHWIDLVGDIMVQLYERTQGVLSNR